MARTTRGLDDCRQRQEFDTYPLPHSRFDIAGQEKPCRLASDHRMNDVRPKTFGQVRQEVVAKAGPAPMSSTANDDLRGVQVLPEFSTVTNLVAEGCPMVFVTGGAGTGKSTLIKWLDREFHGESLLCAPTGIAALTIGGKSIHSLCQFPPAWLLDTDIKRLPKTPASFAKLLIIDEVSMVNANVLDALDKFFKLNRDCQELPFGGVQVVMVGDLFQLPPIVTRQTLPFFESYYTSEKFFAAHCIEAAHVNAVELTRPFRQTDKDFVALLNAVRCGERIAEALEWLNARCPSSGAPSDGAVWLCPRNDAVERINSERLRAIRGTERTYEAMLRGKFREDQLPAPSKIQLKVGAQVTLVTNDLHWVNGSVATVRQMSPESIQVELSHSGKVVEVHPYTWEQYDYAVDEETGLIERSVVGKYEQLPVLLSWAMTIHKSQGRTLDRVHLDLGQGAFATGQTYVALSRCRSLSTLSLARPLSASDIKVDLEARAFYEALFD